jgi:large subunit ribosomal protein L24
MHIKKEDRVLVLKGKDRGKTGRVLSVFPETNRVLVERVNLMKHHSRRRDQRQQGGIIEREVPIHASNVILICPRCNRQSRTYRKRNDDGSYVGRVCRKCQEVVDT